MKKTLTDQIRVELVRPFHSLNQPSKFIKNYRIFWLTSVLILCYGLSPLFAQKNYNQVLSKSRVYNNKTATANAKFINDKTMVFEVNALYNAKANGYIAIFNMTQLGKTAQDASKLLNERYANFVKEVNALGIPNSQIFVDMVSMMPIFEYEEEKKLFSKTFIEVPKSFELKKNVHVFYKDARQLDKVVEVATNNEIYDLIKVDYFVENTENIYDQLRNRSVLYLNKKLQSFRKLGVRLDTNYRVITEKSSVSSPVDNYSNYFVLSSTPGHISKRNRANVRQIRKPSTRFYNQISYKKFDVIINPVVKEPMVQYSYNLKVKYLIREKPRQTAKVVKKYYLVTADGTIKALNVND